MSCVSSIFVAKNRRSVMLQKGDLVRREIEKGNYPIRIYKYYRLNDNLLKSIEHRYLWFDSFKNYNDPYEGKCNVLKDYTESEICLRLRQLGRVPNMSYEEIRPTCNNAIAVALKENEEETRICCFTSKNDDLLMWAHYADAYRGVCLEFDTAELVDSLDMSLVHVRYEKEYPIVDFLFKMDAVTMQQLFTKAKVWEYEDEYRFISPYRIANKQPFEISALKSVIIGCKCDINSDAFKRLLRLLPAHVKIRQSIMDSSEYKLKIE